MRTLTVLALAATTLALAPVHAAGVVSAQDAMGDQSFNFYPRELVQELGVGAVGPRCRDAATDLTGLALATDGGVLTVTMTVADAGSRFVTCDGSSFDRVRATWNVELSPSSLTCAPEDIVCSPYGETLSFNYMTSARDEFSCITVQFPEGIYSGCIGLAERVGNSIRWSLPLEGTFVSDVGDVRSYDLRGDVMDISNGASSNLGIVVEGGSFPVPVSLRDSVPIQRTLVL